MKTQHVYKVSLVVLWSDRQYRRDDFHVITDHSDAKEAIAKAEQVALTGDRYANDSSVKPSTVRVESVEHVLSAAA